MLARKQLHWWFTLLVLILSGVMIALGFWQLSRFHSKKNLLFLSQNSSKQPVITLAVNNSQEQTEFQPVKVQGNFLGQKTLLLDNRWHQKQFGFEVLTPFQIKDTDTILLVNRGWIPKSAITKKADFAGVSSDQQVIQGYLKTPTKRGIILGKNIQKYANGFVRVQKINVKDIGEYLRQPIYPFVLRLDPAAAQGFVRQWTVVVGKPERHLGYALQWFLMAMTLLVIYCIFAYRVWSSQRHG